MFGSRVFAHMLVIIDTHDANRLSNVVCCFAKVDKLYNFYDLKVGKEEYCGNCSISLESTTATSVQINIVYDNICQIATHILI